MTIDESLLHDSAETVAAKFGLEYDEENDAVVLDGWYADDGNWPIYYPHAQNGEEAAREYAEGFDAKEYKTSWVTINVWRKALKAETVPCAYCDNPACAHDRNGDPACAEHADTPREGITLQPLETLVTTIEIEKDSHKVTIEPDEPPCPEGKHLWAAPYAILGGCESNPGVWGHGGGYTASEICVYCGILRTLDTWAQDPTDGTQGLKSVAYDTDRWNAEERLSRLKQERLKILQKLCSNKAPPS
jgi:hypothetical protein